jgi:tetratricopeptide (TPR) repeat protein
LGDLSLNGEARLLLEADLYAREGLLAEAITAYQKFLLVQDIPEVRVTLGDILLEVGLSRLAANTYREVLDRNSEIAAQAAAEFGLGRVEYNRINLNQAACHFSKARELYTSLSLKKEAATAAQGEEMTKRRCTRV